MNCTVDLCLLCITTSENLNSILSQDSEGILIEEKCRYFLNELVNIKQEVSYHICLQCLKILNYIYNFKQMCIQNVNKLNSYVDTVRNIHGPYKHLKVTLKDLEHLKENDLTCGNENLPPIEEVLVKEEITDNHAIQEDIVSEAEAMNVDDECSGKENLEDVPDETDNSNLFEERRTEKFQREVKKTENKFKDIREETNLKDAQFLFEITYSDSDDDSNEILQNEGTNSAEPTSPSSSKKRPYKCDMCDKAFTQPHHLLTHKRVHTGEKPYKCDDCQKAFTQSKYLVQHRRVHTGEKPYKCDICGKAYTQRTTLVNHQRLHTGEIRKIPFECDECNKAFVSRIKLEEHKRIHTGEKPFKCDVCDRSFTLGYNLVHHKRTHNSERPYKCDVCNKAFSQQTNLVIHKRVHTGEQPYKCDVCDKAFNHRISLVKHKRTHTG